MQKYLVNTTGMHANVASVIMTAALFVFMLIQPLIGALSDKIGRRTSMLILRHVRLMYRPHFNRASACLITLCRICFGDAGDGDCEFLHLDQRDTQG